MPGALSGTSANGSYAGMVAHAVRSYGGDSILVIPPASLSPRRRGAPLHH